ncbi:MAG: anaerobic ribonucleoside-triphosphate reductase activating protein [Firmicutes bacterium HGW-Firmicutes-1]|jgi:pyruvate formate lyase activating enzyme|nr:MAG: anaerobic ribonucleoside-triphosphate reductase activating protein [Firmicutes bacterium HGW-Firmicutes-1]
MQIKGLIKTSLVDYPEQIASTIFVGGCNMRCPFCHNRDLVLNNLSDLMSINTLLDFLKTRKNTHEAVCITGGEPTLHADLLDFLKEVKNIGYKIKLDTNGLMPNIVESAFQRNLLDYVAMDIKNSKLKYPLTSGITTEQVNRIEVTINLLKESNISYEFRTTVVKEFHTLEDLELIGKWLSGSKKYVLQQYKPSNYQLTPEIFTAYSNEELEEIKDIISPFFSMVDIRA